VPRPPGLRRSPGARCAERRARLGQAELRPGTQHGRKATDATNWALEQDAAAAPALPGPRESTAEARRKAERLFRRKALQGPPHLGQSLIPRPLTNSAHRPVRRRRGASAAPSPCRPAARPPALQALTHEELQSLVPRVAIDTRPAWVAESAAARAVVKRARKQLQAHVRTVRPVDCLGQSSEARAAQPAQAPKPELPLAVS